MDITDGFTGLTVMPFIVEKSDQNGDGEAEYYFSQNSGGFVTRFEPQTNIGDWEAATLLLRTNIEGMTGADIDLFMSGSWTHTDPTAVSKNPFYEMMGMGLFYTVELVILAVELLLVFNPSGTGRRFAAVVGFLALAIPLALLISGGFGNMKTMGLAGLTFLVGMFFTRFDFIIAGQLPPMRAGLAGSGVETVRGLMHSTPDPGEWMIFALGLGLFFFLYFMSERYLILEDASH